jgi:hypothetical protein
MLKRRGTETMTSKWTKLYGTERWRRVARMYLAANPMCVRCEEAGRTQEARVCHHVNEWRPNSTVMDFWAGPFSGLCFDCHFELHHGGRPRDFSTAIDESGWPCDLLHPVFQTNVAKRERE